MGCGGGPMRRTRNIDATLEIEGIPIGTPDFTPEEPPDPWTAFRRDVWPLLDPVLGPWLDKLQLAGSEPPQVAWRVRFSKPDRLPAVLRSLTTESFPSRERPEYLIRRAPMPWSDVQRFGPLVYPVVEVAGTAVEARPLAWFGEVTLHAPLHSVLRSTLQEPRSPLTSLSVRPEGRTVQPEDIGHAVSGRPNRWTVRARYADGTHHATEVTGPPGTTALAILQAELNRTGKTWEDGERVAGPGGLLGDDAIWMRRERPESSVEGG